ncbi:MAG: MBG domain-containing protein, partial [Desulfuromonadales bacterium]
AGNANYSAAADVDQSFVVGKAALTITTNDKVRFAKVANPTFSATYSGFVNGDTAAVLGGALTFATAATITSDPGTYPITPAGQTSGNYTITFVPGTLTVRVIGDISGGSGSSDGVFDLADALKYLRISLGLDPAPASLDGIKMAPVIGGVPSMPTGGSRVTVGDVVAALEHLVGLW